MGEEIESDDYPDKQDKEEIGDLKEIIKPTDKVNARIE